MRAEPSLDLMLDQSGRRTVSHAGPSESAPTLTQSGNSSVFNAQLASAASDVGALGLIGDLATGPKIACVVAFRCELYAKQSVCEIAVWTL